MEFFSGAGAVGGHGLGAAGTENFDNVVGCTLRFLIIEQANNRTTGGTLRIFKNLELQQKYGSMVQLGYAQYESLAAIHF